MGSDDTLAIELSSDFAFPEEGVTYPKGIVLILVGRDCLSLEWARSHGTIWVPVGSAEKSYGRLLKVSGSRLEAHLREPRNRRQQSLSIHGHKRPSDQTNCKPRL